MKPLLVAVSALMPLSVAAETCPRPEQPACVVGSERFADLDELKTCRDALTGYTAEVRAFGTCMREQTLRVNQEARAVAKAFRCRATGGEACEK